MEAVAFEILDWATIVARFPDEWVVLGDPEKQNMKVLGGTLIAHHADKRVVCLEAKDFTADFEKITLLFTGQIKPMRQIGLLGRVHFSA